MITITVISVLLLALLPAWALSGFRRWKAPSAVSEEKVTVLIPFRNEADRIPPLLKSLENMAYDNLEILLINDHSEDAGVQIAEGWAETRQHVRLIHNASDQHGKKYALENGVRAASGTIILTTDADCILGKEWVRVLAGYFTDPSVHLVAGLVAPVEQQGLFFRLISLEMAALTGISAGSLGHKVPTMCNGASLAFRRSSFEQVGGHKDNLSVPSGDDEFLLHKMFAAFPDGLRYCTDPRGLARTDATSDPAAWVQQRIRWSSKWRARQSGTWLGPLLAFCYLIMLGGWTYALITGNGLIELAGITLLKWIADYALVQKVMRSWSRRPNLIFFLICELLYPLYVVIFAVLSFKRQYEWKGRRYKEALT